MTTHCRICGSAKIIPDVRVMDYDDETGDRDLRILIRGDTSDLGSMDRVYRELQAQVCCECGHTEFFVKDPEEIWNEYQASR